MKRRDLIRLSSVPLAMVGMSPLRSLTQPKAALPHELQLSNSAFLLTLTAGNGLWCRLVHTPTGAILADGEYSYSFGNPVFTAVRRDSEVITLIGETDTGILVEHQVAVGLGTSWLEEQITLTNHTPAPLDLYDVRGAFLCPTLPTQKTSDAKSTEDRFVAVPFLREPGDSARRYREYSLDEILTEQFESTLWDKFMERNDHSTPKFAAEGWIWSRREGRFLVTKYSQGGMEWCILDRAPISQGRVALRWGGFGIYRGQPERAKWLLPKQSHRFGTTRLTWVKGDQNQAFYAFRTEMTERGHGCPADFNPPLHWNELYDNKLYMASDDIDSPEARDDMDSPEARKKYYSLADLRQQADQAKFFGCEALYLDPGWDTNFGSKIWDETRLGSFKSFTSMLKREYGLECSLHTPLSGWCNPSSYSPECYRRDCTGKRTTWEELIEALGHENRFFASPICGASIQYVEETGRRLNKLARDGAVFLMFDGTDYHDECWDTAHGHDIPARMEEHVQATFRLARRVHEKYPDVLVEMHDAVVGGARSHFTPIYYGHGHCDSTGQECQARGFDSVWAFELMSNPMEDLLSGRAIAFYYYSLAYSLPLYIHINLRTDNQNALVFWWNASTCRHLGIGGTHADPAVVGVHRRAVQTYMRLKPYFCSGTFYGLDEMTHVHTGPDRSSALINCFNLQNQAVEREIRFEPETVGLDPSKTYKLRGARLQQVGTVYVGTVTIPARGHTLIEIA